MLNSKKEKKISKKSLSEKITSLIKQVENGDTTGDPLVDAVLRYPSQAWGDSGSFEIPIILNAVEDVKNLRTRLEKSRGEYLLRSTGYPTVQEEWGIIAKEGEVIFVDNNTIYINTNKKVTEFSLARWPRSINEEKENMVYLPDYSGKNLSLSIEFDSDKVSYLIAGESERRIKELKERCNRPCGSSGGGG